jgi:hypothetical protein
VSNVKSLSLKAIQKDINNIKKKVRKIMKNYKELISRAEGEAENAISNVMKLGQEMLDLTKYAEKYEPSYTTDGLIFVNKDDCLDEIQIYDVLKEAMTVQKDKKK